MPLILTRKKGSSAIIPRNVDGAERPRSGFTQAYDARVLPVEGPDLYPWSAASSKTLHPSCRGQTRKTLRHRA